MENELIDLDEIESCEEKTKPEKKKKKKKPAQQIAPEELKKIRNDQLINILFMIVAIPLFIIGLAFLHLSVVISVLLIICGLLSLILGVSFYFKNKERLLRYKK